MKATISLPERPSGLFLLAVLDILVVLLIFFALIPVVAQQTGYGVQTATAGTVRPQINPSKTVVLTVRAEPRPVFRLDQEAVQLEELGSRLETLKEEKGIVTVVAILDRQLENALFVELMEIVLAAGLEFQGGLTAEATGGE